MITVRHTESIRLPLTDVYGLLGCYQYDVLWRTNLHELVQDAPGLARSGMQFNQVIQLLGQAMTLTIEVTVAAPNRRTACESVGGPVRLWEQRIFERSEKGTLVTYELSIELKGWQRLTAPLLVSQLQRQVKTDLEAFKTLVETTPNPLVELPRQLAARASLTSPSTS